VTQPTSPPKTTTKAPSSSPGGTISNPDTVSFADGQLANSVPPPLLSNASNYIGGNNGSSNISSTAQNVESSAKSKASLMTWQGKMIVLFLLPLIHFLLC
jgi:hypothetical protein